MARHPRFFFYLSLVCAGVVLVGFAPTYFLRPFFGLPPLTLRVHLHGLVFSAWIGLFVLQSALIRGGHRDLHRALGLLGAALAVSMVWLGTALALHQTADRLAAGRLVVGFPPLQFLAIQLLDLVQFVVFVVLALVWRARPQAHKRLMMLATLSIIAPAIGRLPLPPLWKFVLPMLAVVGCMVYDGVQRRRIHPAFLFGGAAFLIDTPARIVIGKTAAWQSFAGWLTGVHSWQ